MYLRNKGITDTSVLSALEKIPREAFIPQALIDQAYEDIALPIGSGQTISQPYVVAKMTQYLELSDRDKVLEIGTGSGYQACILSKLCRRVYSIERYKNLLEEAERKFTALNIHNITSLCGDGMKGWPQQAPFDKIIVTAAARNAPPDELLNQLKVGGIMIIPIGNSGDQTLKRYKKESDDTFAVKDIFPVRFVPLLPDVVKTTDNEQSMHQIASN